MISMLLVLLLAGCSQPGGEEAANAPLDNEIVPSVAPTPGPLIETATIPIELSGADGGDATGGATTGGAVDGGTVDGGTTGPAGTTTDKVSDTDKEKGKILYYRIKGKWKQQSALPTLLDKAFAMVEGLFIGTAHALTSDAALQEGIRDILISPPIPHPLDSSKVVSLIGVLTEQGLLLYEDGVPSEDWATMPIEVAYDDNGATKMRPLGHDAYLFYLPTTDRLLIVEKKNLKDGGSTEDAETKYAHILAVSGLMTDALAKLTSGAATDVTSAVKQLMGSMTATELASMSSLSSASAAYSQLRDVAVRETGTHLDIAMAWSGGEYPNAESCLHSTVTIVRIMPNGETSAQPLPIVPGGNQCGSAAPLSVAFLADGDLVVTASGITTDSSAVHSVIRFNNADQSTIHQSYVADDRTEIFQPKGKSWFRADAQQGGYLVAYAEKGFEGPVKENLPQTLDVLKQQEVNKLSLQLQAKGGMTTDAAQSAAEQAIAEAGGICAYLGLEAGDYVDVGQDSYCAKIVIQPNVSPGLKIYRYDGNHDLDGNGLSPIELVDGVPGAIATYEYTNNGQHDFVQVDYDPLSDKLLVAYSETTGWCPSGDEAGLPTTYRRYEDTESMAKKIGVLDETEALRFASKGLDYEFLVDLQDKFLLGITGQKQCLASSGYVEGNSPGAGCIVFDRTSRFRAVAQGNVVMMAGALKPVNLEVLPDHIASCNAMACDQYTQYATKNRVAQYIEADYEPVYEAEEVVCAELSLPPGGDGSDDEPVTPGETACVVTYPNYADASGFMAGLDTTPIGAVTLAAMKAGCAQSNTDKVEFMTGFLCHLEVSTALATNNDIEMYIDKLDYIDTSDIAGSCEEISAL